MEECSEHSYTVEELKAAYREAGVGPELVESGLEHIKLESDSKHLKLEADSDKEIETQESHSGRSLPTSFIDSNAVNLLENYNPKISVHDDLPETPNRKRKKDPSKWAIEIQKKRRLNGKTYLGYNVMKNGAVFKRTLSEKKPEPDFKPSCSSSVCRKSKLRNCELFSEADRKHLFQHYWSELDWQQKRVYILSYIEKVPTNRTQSQNEVSRRTETLFYYLERDGKKLKVCQKMFINTLGVGQNQIFRWVKSNKLNRMVNGASPKSERTAIQRAKEFIHGLPKMESHYCRRETTKMYLEPIFESKAKLFRVYQEFCATQKHPAAAKKKFQNLLNEMNIGVFLPKKDKCDTCCGYEAGNISYEMWKNHVTNKEEARKSKDADKKNSIVGLCHALVVDVQAVNLSPMINASAMYYKTKLMVHNYSIFDLSTRDVDSLPIVILSDGCTNQNRNKILSNALLGYSERTGKIIMQKYLEKGHTKMEVDSVHSLIERKLKGKAIYHPLDYVEITREARTTGIPYEAVYMEHSMFLDYSQPESMKYCDIRPGSKTGDPCVTDIRELRYDPSGKIQYKLNHSLDWTDLRKKSRNMNPRGIPNLYQQKLLISKRKYKDLQELLAVIPKKHHDFYTNLPN